MSHEVIDDYTALEEINLHKPEDHPRCDHCSHFDSRLIHHFKAGVGEQGTCRIDPPTMSGWPKVHANDWCAKFALPLAKWSKHPIGKVPTE